MEHVNSKALLRWDAQTGDDTETCIDKTDGQGTFSGSTNDISVGVSRNGTIGKAVSPFAFTRTNVLHELGRNSASAASRKPEPVRTIVVPSQ